MNTLTHIVSAPLIALTVAQIEPGETHYIYLAMISAGIIDLDHLVEYGKKYPFFKKYGYNKKTMHHARSTLHELPGIVLFASLFFVLALFHLKLALVLFLPVFIHLIQDYLVGISYPFNPLDRHEIQLSHHNLMTDHLINIIIILISGILWKLYLSTPSLAMK